MDDLTERVIQNSAFAIYIHLKDVPAFVKYAKKIVKKKFKVDKSSYQVCKDKENTSTGVFAIVCNQELTFSDNPKDVENYPLYVWNKRKERD